MKFQISQKDFYEGIQIVQRAVSNKNTLPILSGILIKTEDKRLKLVATDLELGIECYINAEIISTGEIVIPANHLLNIIRELPSMIVTVDCDLQKKSAEIVCGQSKFKLNGYPADDFPFLPKIEESTPLTLTQAKLKEMIEQVKIATSNDETQPFLNGALLKIVDDQLKMVATNSYRLAYRSDQLKEANSEKLELIIPNKTLSEMARILSDQPDETISLQVTNNQILFALPDVMIISRLIDGRFPDYEPVIPRNSKTFIKLDRKELLQALKRIFWIATSNSNIVRASIANGQLIFESIDSEIGQAHEELDVTMEGPSLEISFNVSYLIDGLKVLDTEEVELCFNGKLSPFLLRPVSEIQYTYVISPTRY